MRVIWILLVVIFSASLTKGIDVLLRNSSTDRLLFEGAGVGLLFWVVMPLYLISLAIALWYLWYPSELRYRIAQIAVILGVIHSSIESTISLNNPELLKQAYIASRTARGLRVHEELLHYISNPLTHLLPLVISIVLGVVSLFLLHQFKKGQRSLS
jgi:hypothetical protein